MSLGPALLALLIATQADPAAEPPEDPVEERDLEEEPPPELDEEPKPKPKPKPEPEPKPATKPSTEKAQAKPRPSPPPAPAPQPRATPQPAPAPVAKPPPKVDEPDPHADKVRAELAKLNLASTPDALERACGQWLPRDFAQKHPVLYARLQVCLVDAAMRADRGAVVEQRLKSAFDAVRGAGPGLATRALTAELLLYKAQLHGRRLLSTPRCSVALGLPGLRRIEVERLRRELGTVVSAFGDVIATREPRFARRALFEIARVYDRLDEELRTRVPDSFRLVNVDDPFAWSRVRPDDLLRPTALGEPSWAAEVQRTLRSLEADPGTDPDLRQRVKDSLAAIEKRTTVYSAAAEAPWGPPPRGAIRHRSDGYLRRQQGGWAPIPEVEARAAIAAQLAAGPGDPAWPFALVAHVLGGGKLNEGRWKAGLASDKPASRLATLVALSHAPRSNAYEPLLQHFANTPASSGALFSTLARSLFGEREWTLRALRAVVSRDRNLALQVTYAKQLPVDERIWLVAELGEKKATARVQELQHGPERQQAIAIYAAFRAAGERMSWMARKGGPGLVGCVSAAVLDELAERKTRALEAQP